MIWSKVNLIIVAGVLINILLAVFFIIVYFSVQPEETDLKAFPMAKMPVVENTEMENLMNKLKKVEELPIDINPTEFGKINPYN